MDDLRTDQVEMQQDEMGSEPSAWGQHMMLNRRLEESILDFVARLETSPGIFHLQSNGSPQPASVGPVHVTGEHNSTFVGSPVTIIFNLPGSSPGNGQNASVKTAKQPKQFREDDSTIASGSDNPTERAADRSLETTKASHMTAATFVIEVEAVIKGYHYFRTNPEKDEVLECVPEENNKYDKFAVLVNRPNGEPVGRVPLGLSKTLCQILLRNVPITSIPTGPPRASSWPWPRPFERGGGIVIPCIFRIHTRSRAEGDAVYSAIMRAITLMDMKGQLDVKKKYWEGEKGKRKGHY